MSDWDRKPPEVMNELALFAGAGGGILGGSLLGWRTICAVERDDYAASVLLARQNDGLLPPFPVWDDVRTFDGRPWRGIVDVVSGGFPCQDISAAGKGAGITGERSGLWMEMARIIGQVRPRYAFVENSPMLTVRGLGVVLGDLAALGFDARWGVLGAADVGAPHLRERIWIRAERRDVANDPQHRRRKGRDGRPDPSHTRQSERPLQAMANSRREHGNRGQNIEESSQRNPAFRRETVDHAQRRGEVVKVPDHLRVHDGYVDYGPTAKERPMAGEERQPGIGWWGSEPDVGRVVNGVAARVDRLKAIGNGQVPQCAAEAWRVLTGRLNHCDGL